PYDVENFQQFGYAVALSGEYALVGAPGASLPGGERGGAVYVFHKNLGGGENWGELTKLTGTDTIDGDNFGNATALNGETAVIGACTAGSAGTQPGAVYVFFQHRGGTDNWGQVEKVTAGDAEDGDQYGWSVAAYESFLFIGAGEEDGPGTNRGAVYVYANE
ncbi:MAG TPA: hypothetical protein ENN69_03035, partial [Spirochaetia bacterium]|nr:hypothetical protein [Spirochaetia bacterium]